MKSIILMGYMGSGKTTVGRQLALSLGIQFYDLDWYIEMPLSLRVLCSLAVEERPASSITWTI